MDLHQLTIFCQVVESGSFSKAAETLGLSQPAVSIQVKRLEEDLGTRLFDRSRTQAVTLTSAGCVLYDRARDLLRHADDTRRAVLELQGLLRGHLTVGASSLAGEYLLPPILVLFHRDYPGIELALKVADTDTICGLVRSGELELGVVGAEVQARELVFERLLDDEMVIIVPTDHPWASRKRASVKDLKDVTFLLPGPTSGIRIVLAERLRELGIGLESLPRTIEMGTTEAIKAGVENGLGVSIVPMRTVVKELKAGLLATLPLRDLDLSRPMFLVTHRLKTLSAASKAFIERLKSDVADKET